MSTSQTSLASQGDTKVFEGFERSMLGRDLAVEVAACERQELAPLFLNMFRDAQPVLEAGCGSGKWLHYFKRHGIASIGLDWSEQLQAVSRQFDSSVQFDTGDLRSLPYEAETFGSVVALGSVEHVIEGPNQILREFHRVLRKGGVGVITVPYYSPLGRATYGTFGETGRRLKRISWVRKLAGKAALPRGNPVSRRELLEQRFRKDIYLETDFDGYFFEYQFIPRQFSAELQSAGFQVERIFPFAGEFGLFMRFGRLVGKYDRRSDELQLGPLGRLLSRLFPAPVGGHMLCTIVRKEPRGI
jgi:SAM-dependent methyltransferase